MSPDQFGSHLRISIVGTWPTPDVEVKAAPLNWCWLLSPLQIINKRILRSNALKYEIFMTYADASTKLLYKRTCLMGRFFFFAWILSRFAFFWSIALRFPVANALNQIDGEVVKKDWVTVLWRQTANTAILANRLGKEAIDNITNRRMRRFQRRTSAILKTCRYVAKISYITLRGMWRLVILLAYVLYVHECSVAEKFVVTGNAKNPTYADTPNRATIRSGGNYR